MKKYRMPTSDYIDLPCRKCLVFILSMFALAACSDDDSIDSLSRLPVGPVAVVSETLTGGSGLIINGSVSPAMPEGYVEQEYVAAGTASDYRAVDPFDDLGFWTLEPDTSAEFRTRVIVRRPADAASASGTVIVEWLNVSGGVDADPDYASFNEEIIRQGHIWLGVSAQLIGVEGGPVLVTVPGAFGVAGVGLKASDPDRYSTLAHPGDGYSFDIFTQIARAARNGGQFLGGTVPDLVLAAGESQSGIALTTYYNGVQPLTKMFDGFFIHSRASVGLPLAAPGGYADLTSAILTMTLTILRTDLNAPVLVLQAESDVIGPLNSVAVRQADSDVMRLWEVAGTAHADAHLLGKIANSIDCGTPINDAPMHLVAKAALRGLEEWARTGVAPPSAPLLNTTGGNLAIERNADGIALGGVRTPPIDVPVEVLSGVAGPRSDLICILLGSTTSMSEGRLMELYTSDDDYQTQYTAAADAAIAAGYVLAEDRAALNGYSHPERLP